jgi:hypothetical protein
MSSPGGKGDLLVVSHWIGYVFISGGCLHQILIPFNLVFVQKKIYNFDKQLQVRKREKMAKLREEIAVQKAKETELNKTIYITGLISQSKF